MIRFLTHVLIHSVRCCAHTLCVHDTGGTEQPVKKTQLQSSFSGNLLAIGADGLQPQRFTLRGLLTSFLDFRFRTVRRRTAFELGKVRGTCAAASALQRTE
jgi:DNA gyrase/topoisomerase IV subunit A